MNVELHYFNQAALDALKAQWQQAGLEKALLALKEAGYVQPETTDLDTALSDVESFVTLERRRARAVGAVLVR